MSLADPSLARTAAYICRLQLPSGGIPWFEGGIIDPWDHVEAIMGLTVGGHVTQARQGFEWLRATQSDNGSWYAAYSNTEPVDATRAETNFVAYVATGLWHYFLVTSDRAGVARYWPMVDRAIRFVLSLQSPHGEIYWALDARRGVCRDALVTGCSSIHKSLHCAALLARTVGAPDDTLLRSRARLQDAIRNKPHRFDRTWPSKSRYAMDWFYPVLGGVYEGDAARTRLAERWHEFVEEGLGCRCVVEEPWVTVAETCELAISTVAAGTLPKAQSLFEDLRQFQLEDGSWWTGYVFPDDLHWPDERPTWTAAAVLLAADAIYELTPAHGLFTTTD